MKIVFLDFDGVMDNAKNDIYLINTIFNYHKNHFFAKILYFFLANRHFLSVCYSNFAADFEKVPFLNCF